MADVQYHRELSPDRRIRTIIYTQTFLVACCAVLSLSDRGLFISPTVSAMAINVVAIFIWPACFAWIIAPILLCAALGKKHGTSLINIDVLKNMKVLLAEAILWFGQFFVLLPSVM